MWAPLSYWSKVRISTSLDIDVSQSRIFLSVCIAASIIIMNNSQISNHCLFIKFGIMSRMFPYVCTAASIIIKQNFIQYISLYIGCHLSGKNIILLYLSCNKPWGPTHQFWIKVEGGVIAGQWNNIFLAFLCYTVIDRGGPIIRKGLLPDRYGNA